MTVGLSIGQGSLADKPFSELLLQVIASRTSGLLTLKKGKVKRQIYFKNGQLVGLNSNSLSDSFAKVVESKKRVDSEGASRIRQGAHLAGISQPEFARQQGMLSEAEIQQGLSLQARMRLLTAIKWQVGDYVYKATKQLLESDAVKALNVPKIMLQLLRLKPEELKRLRPLILSRGEDKPLRIADGAYDMSRMGLTEPETRWLQSLEGTKSVKTLLSTTPLAPADTITLLYAAWVGGIVGVKDTVPAMAPPPPPSTSAAAMAPPPPPSTSAAAMAPPPPASTGSAVMAPPPPPSSSAAVMAPPPPPSTSAAVMAPPPPPSSSAAMAPPPPASSIAAMVAPPPPASSSAAAMAPPPPASTKADEAKPHQNGVNGAASGPNSDPLLADLSSSWPPVEKAEQSVAEEPASGNGMDFIGSLIAEEVGEYTGPVVASADNTPGSLLEFSMAGFTEDELKLATGFREEFPAMKEQNYFEYFGLERSATSAEIRKAYYLRAKNCHPDKLVNAPKPIQDLGLEIFNLLQVAYDTLTDAEAREKYVSAVFYGKQMEEQEAAVAKVETVLKADAIFKKGIGMLNAGHLRGAHNAFKQAVEIYGDEPEYRACYGFTTFRLNFPKNRQVWEDAEQVILGAIEANPKSDRANYFMGRICLAKKKPNRARKYFVRALKANPRNVDAMREYKTLKNAPKEEDKGVISSFLSRFKK